MGRRCLKDKRIAELKDRIRAGIEKSNGGEGIDGKEVFDEIEEDICRIEAQKQPTEGAK